MASVRPAAVGGFVLGGLAIAVAAILFFGGIDRFAPKTKAVVYFQDSVGGLTVGAPVTFRGVAIGSVARVALLLDPSNLTARIPVYLQLEPDRVTLIGKSAQLPLLRQMVEAGLRAKLVPQSLVTGQMLVELDLSPGSPAHFVGPTDGDVTEIPAVQSDLQELREQLSRAPVADTVAQALRTLVAFEKLANRIDGEIGPLLTKANDVLDSTGRTMDSANATITRLSPELSSDLEDAHHLVLDARQQLAARGEDVNRTLSEADKTLQAARGLMASANSLVALRSQSRGDIDASLRDLAATASSFRDFAESIERDPGLLLRGRSSR
jgi:paraquat-inducible protein B